MSVNYMERRPFKSKIYKYTKAYYHRNGETEFLEKYFYKDRAFIKMGDILPQKEPELRNRLKSRCKGYKSFTRNRFIRRGRTLDQTLYNRKKRAQMAGLPYN